MVQEAMCRVKADLINHQAHENIQQSRWKIIQMPEVGNSANTAQDVEEISKWETHKYLIEQYQKKCLKNIKQLFQ